MMLLSWVVVPGAIVKTMTKTKTQNDITEYSFKGQCPEFILPPCPIGQVFESKK